MSVKIFGIYEKGEPLPAMYIQAKTRKTAEKCVDEYKKNGRLDATKEYEVRS